MQRAHFQQKFPAYGVLLISALFFQAANAQAQLKPGACFDYKGRLGKSTRIGMTLYAEDRQLKGSYFYQTHMEDIPLTGRYTALREISLTEIGKRGEIRGTFVLRFAENDPQFKSNEPLQAEVLVGNWTSADGTLTYPVHLQMEQNCSLPGQARYAVAGAKNDEIVEKNAQGFYDAILAGKAEIAASYVSYPCSYFSGGKRKIIQSPADFLKLYPQIFTTIYVSEIAKGTPHHMFANDQGIMIADGKVWFDANGKAIHLNNEAPRQ
jgi:hypothetical protein